MEITTIGINKPKKRKYLEEDERGTLSISTLKIGSSRTEGIDEEIRIDYNPQNISFSSKAISFEDGDKDVDEEFNTLTIQIPPIDQYLHLLLEKPEVWYLHSSIFALIADYKVCEGMMVLVIQNIHTVHHRRRTRSFPLESKVPHRANTNIWSEPPSPRKHFLFSKSSAPMGTAWGIY